MLKPTDNITVGRVTLPYNELLRGWLTPLGHVINNPLKAQRIAEQLNGSITLH